MTTQNHYTFGDSERAARRLALLARAYETPSRRLLERFAPDGLTLALDLGAGPGHTTRLVHEVSRARRTIGLEASERYVEQARSTAAPSIEFMREDVPAPSAAVPPAGLVFSRFLLTHVSDAAAALRAFRPLVTEGGLLLVQETAAMESTHPALARYYELVGELQAHYGQLLYVGRMLEGFAERAPYSIVHSTIHRFEQPARTMAEIHLSNLRTWRADAFAQREFDQTEIADLEARLASIASGAEHAEAVAIGLGELVLRA
jgi:trans-aconitate 2-methyltransferase